MGKKKSTGKGFSQAQVDAAAQITDGGRNPKDVLQAFLAGDITFQDIKLPPLNLARFMALEAVDSPLIDGPTSKRVATARDIAQGLVLLTCSLPEARRLVNDTDDLERLTWQFAESVQMNDLLKAGQVINSAIAQGFKTVIGGQKKTQATASPAAASADSAGG